MAKGYLALEITPTRIRFVHMQHTMQGYRVHKSGSVPHALNVLAKGELTKAVKEILVKEAIHPQRLFVTICRQGNFIRQMLTPRLNLPELEEVITSEIEKLPVFSSNKYDFIYHSAKSVREKLNVVLAAIDQNTLSYVIDESQKLKIPLEHLEIAPLNIKEILPVQKHAALQSQAIVVVHDHMSYLMIIHGKECRFVYQAAIGTQHLYPHQNGQIADSVLSGLTSELQRGIKAYLTEYKLEAINQYWITWDHQGAQGLDQLIAAKMGVECAILDLAKVPHFESVKNPAGENPILALTAVPLIVYAKKVKEQFPLNHFFRAMHIKRYAMRCLLLALIIVGLFGSVFGIKALDFYQKRNQLSLDIENMTAEREALKAASADLYRKRDEYVRIRQGLLDQATFVRNLNRISWSEVLSVVAKEMPKKMALSSFKFSETGSVAFFGDALEVEVIAELIRRVDTSKILYEGKFDFLTEKMVEKQKIYSFGILAQLQSKEEEQLNNAVTMDASAVSQIKDPLTNPDVNLAANQGVAQGTDEKAND